MLLSDHFAHHDDDLQEFILLAAEQYDDKPHLFDMVGSCQFLGNSNIGVKTCQIFLWTII
jgi:hypothetical protein